MTNSYGTLLRVLLTGAMIACASDPETAPSTNVGGSWRDVASEAGTVRTEYLWFVDGRYLAGTQETASGATTNLCEAGTYVVAADIVTLKAEKGGSRQLKTTRSGDTLSVSTLSGGVASETRTFLPHEWPVDLPCKL